MTGGFYHHCFDSAANQSSTMTISENAAVTRFAAATALPHKHTETHAPRRLQVRHSRWIELANLHQILGSMRGRCSQAGLVDS